MQLVTEIQVWWLKFDFHASADVFLEDDIVVPFSDDDGYEIY
jgi:hypothetical protein